MKRKLRNTSAFTLLELLVAVGIFLLIMTALSMGMFSVQQTWQKVSLQNSNLISYQKLDRLTDSVFRNAIPFKWTDPDFKESLTFKGEPDSVSLAYIHRIGEISDGGIRFVKLFLEDDKLVAAYRSTPILPWEEDETELKKEILSENVASISFLYADKEDEEIVWLNDWDEEDNPNIPLAIQIRIEWDNGIEEVWLRRTAGSGISETFGKRLKKEDT